MYDRGGDPMGGGFAGGPGGFPGGGFDFTNLVDAMFGTQSSRGPRSACAVARTPSSALTLTLAEAAFGITKPLRVGTAVVCPRCNGNGSEGRRGAGDVRHVPRLGRRHPGAAVVPR